MVSHLQGPTEAEVRRALGALDPGLAGEPIEILPAFAVKPQWCRTSVMVADSHVLKVCWSAAAEPSLRRQAQVMTVLDGFDERLPTPRVLAASHDPASLLYCRLPGRPLTHDRAGSMSDASRFALAHDIASALAALHSPAVRSAVAHADIHIAPASAQATTELLRERLLPLVDHDARRWLVACLDWVDSTLRRSSTEVVLHGDWHGWNLLLDDEDRLVGVLDFEEVAVGPPEYDLRYLPRQAPTLDLFWDVLRSYGEVSGYEPDPSTAVAWHVLTDLGDALWRTEADVEVVAGPIQRRADDLRTLLTDGLGLPP